MIIIGLLVLLILCCYSDKIEMTINILKCSGQFVSDLPSVYIILLLNGVAGLMFIGFWISAFIFLLACADPKDNSGNFRWYHLGILYYIFGLFWNIEVLIGFTLLFISFMCSFWYFSPNIAKIKPSLTSLKFIFLYHLGSLFFGALIIALVKFTKFIVD